MRAVPFPLLGGALWHPSAAEKFFHSLMDLNWDWTAAAKSCFLRCNLESHDVNYSNSNFDWNFNYG